MSTFSGLSRAASALYAQQRGLDVTGQNISNVNTDGYTRQRVELQSIGGSVVPALWSKGQDIGQGVSAEQVTRIRDMFLENRAQLEHANQAQLAMESTALTEMEGAFREPGQYGIQKLLADVWKAFGDIQNKPDDMAARIVLMDNAKMLVAGLQRTRSDLDLQWQQQRENLGILVADVNADAGQVAHLNDSIKKATLVGLPANELKDKRDVLVQKLAASIGAVSVAGEDGVIQVSVNGTFLVGGNSALPLVLDGPMTPDAPGSLKIVGTPGNWPIPVGGQAAGRLTALGPATQDGAINKVRSELDTFAVSLAGTINTQHRLGYTLAGTAGTDMFTSISGGPITAADLRLALTAPTQVAAAKYPPDPLGKPSWDDMNADAMGRLKDVLNGPDSQYRNMIINLGVQASVATRNVAIQDVITAQVNGARESVSGVNLDEEMTNMLAFQHAYAAAGRLVTAIDETLDVLINRTGLVGR